jgi:ATP-binding cassette, subfamily G (WHITE), member 2, PDR
MFDKAIVLYEGRQIYFGRTEDAKKYFMDMGFVCPGRQTAPDFLTSLTSPEERIIRLGFENRVPRTPDEFAAIWKSSSAHAQLMKDINDYESRFPIGGESANKFLASRVAQQSRGQYVPRKHLALVIADK